MYTEKYEFAKNHDFSENEEDDSPNSLALKEVDNVIASTNVVSS